MDASASRHNSTRGGLACDDPLRCAGKPVVKRRHMNQVRIGYKPAALYGPVRPCSGIAV